MSDHQKQKTAIDVAVDIFRGQTALANAIGATQPFVSQWVNGIRPVPPKFCVRIEEKTNGAVTCKQLRPDIFGDTAA